MTIFAAKYYLESKFMKRNNVYKVLINGLLSGALVVFMSSCEIQSEGSFIGDDGSVVTYSNGDFVAGLQTLGLKGYSVGNQYTEITYDATAKKPKIKSFRKGELTTVNSSTTTKWSTSNPTLKYGGNGTCYVSYTYNGLTTEVITNDNYFAEWVFIKSGDFVVSQARYTYDATGRLIAVYLERSKQPAADVMYHYPNTLDSSDNEITVTERVYGQETQYYKIKLAKSKHGTNVGEYIENKGYVCDILRFANAPLTNEYVINPDLYYMGLYGVPFKYLPDETIENGTYSDRKEIAIVRVGDNGYYY
jgi:hypothetical protein